MGGGEGERGSITATDRFKFDRSPWKIKRHVQSLSSTKLTFKLIPPPPLPPLPPLPPPPPMPIISCNNNNGNNRNNNDKKMGHSLTTRWVCFDRKQKTHAISVSVGRGAHRFTESVSLTGCDPRQDRRLKHDGRMNPNGKMAPG